MQHLLILLAYISQARHDGWDDYADFVSLAHEN